MMVSGHGATGFGPVGGRWCMVSSASRWRSGGHSRLCLTETSDWWCSRRAVRDWGGWRRLNTGAGVYSNFVYIWPKVVACLENITLRHFEITKIRDKKSETKKIRFFVSNCRTVMFSRSRRTFAKKWKEDSAQSKLLKILPLAKNAKFK